MDSYRVCLARWADGNPDFDITDAGDVTVLLEACDERDAATQFIERHHPMPAGKQSVQVLVLKSGKHRTRRYRVTVEAVPRTFARYEPWPRDRDDPREEED